MTRRHWAAILLIWATGLGVIVAGLLFSGSSVAPCLGITPESNATCVAAWEAQRSWTDRFWETPHVYEILFSGLVAVVVLATVVVYRHAKRHRRLVPPSDIHRR